MGRGVKARAGTSELGGVGRVGLWRCQRVRDPAWAQGLLPPGRRRADLGRSQRADSLEAGIPAHHWGMLHSPPQALPGAHCPAHRDQGLSG